MNETGRDRLVITVAIAVQLRFACVSTCSRGLTLRLYRSIAAHCSVDWALLVIAPIVASSRFNWIFLIVLLIIALELHLRWPLFLDAKFRNYFEF